MAINPLIKQLAKLVRHAPKADEVRDSIAESMEITNELTEDTKTRQDNLDGQFQSVIDNTTGKDVVSAPEILASRVGEDGTPHANLKARLDDEQSRVTAQLAQKTIVVSSSPPLQSHVWYEDRGNSGVEVSPGSGVNVANAIVSSDEIDDKTKLWFDK